MRSLLPVIVLLGAACGDNERPMFDYSNPPKGGALRLVKSKTKPKAETEVVLDLVVGDQPLTGYSVGFNLPLTPGALRLTELVPGTALDPGSAPIAARGVVPSTGPLANHLVTGLAQKAAADATLPAGAVLYTVHLELLGSAPDGVIVDGTATDFLLPSGGMRDRAGTTVVEAKDVAIGKLEVNR